MFQHRILFLLVLLSIFNETIAYYTNLSTNSRHPTSRRRASTGTTLLLLLWDDDDSSSSLVSFPNPVLSRSSFLTATAFSMGALTVLPAGEARAETKENSSKRATTTTTSRGETSAMDVNASLKKTSSDRRQATLNALETNNIQLAASEDSTSLQESISGFVAGGALAAVKTVVKYPLDTVTVRLQMPNAQYSMSDLGRLFSGSYNGVTLSLLSNVPGGAVFFAVKDAAKASLKTAAWTSAAPKWVTTTMAVGAALLPYWIVRNPSEVIKVRQQAGIPGYGEGVSAWDAIQVTFNETTASGGSFLDGAQTFYTGYWENVIYGLPADVIKFVAYEAFTGGRRDLSPLEGARAGAFATAAAQLVTTPLDVIRNRLMTGENNNKSSSRTTPTNGEESAGDRAVKDNYIQTLITLGKEEGLGGLFAGATPRVAKAFLSGAIQFATYEETKQSISRLLQPKR